MYNPFVRGPFPVAVRTAQAIDAARDGRRLIFEIWYPAVERYAGQDFAEASRDIYQVLPSLPPVWQAAVRDAAPHPGFYPLLAFSHSSWGHRRQSTFLCTHLASAGYVVAAVDHTGNTTMDRAQMVAAIPPIGELCPGKHAQLVVCGLGLAHMDAVLKGCEGARRSLAVGLEARLAACGITVTVRE